MATKWIKRTEAAQILGVTAQSISNYAERGVLHEQKRYRSCYFLESEVLALAACPEVYDAERIKEKMEKLFKEQEELRVKTEEKFCEMKSLFHAYFHDQRCWQRYKEVADTAVGIICAEGLNTRERDILDCILRPMPIDQIADRFGITVARVQQVFQKVLRKMKTFSEINETKIASLQETVKEKDELIESLKEQIGEQNYRLAIKENPDLRFKKEYPFNLRLNDYGLSVRASNICKTMGIETIGDLVGTRKLSLIKCRNCGRKTMQELTEVLYRYDLKWEMWNRTKGLS